MLNNWLAVLVEGMAETLASAAARWVWTRTCSSPPFPAARSARAYATNKGTRDAGGRLRPRLPVAARRRKMPRSPPTPPTPRAWICRSPRHYLTTGDGPSTWGTAGDDVASAIAVPTVTSHSEIYSVTPTTADRQVQRQPAGQDVPAQARELRGLRSTPTVSRDPLLRTASRTTFEDETMTPLPHCRVPGTRGRQRPVQARPVPTRSNGRVSRAAHRCDTPASPSRPRSTVRPGRVAPAGHRFGRKENALPSWMRDTMRDGVTLRSESSASASSS